MDQELLMKQIVEQVMAAMKNGTPASAPAAASEPYTGKTALSSSFFTFTFVMIFSFRVLCHA